MSLAAAVSGEGVRYQHVRFVSQANPGEVVLKEFDGPDRQLAVVTPVSSEAVWSSLDDQQPPDGLWLLTFPSGSGGSVQWQRCVEQWMAAPQEAERALPIEAAINGCRVLWRPGQVMVEGPEASHEVLVRALVDFAFFERQLRMLEGEIERDWATAEADVSLIHQVGPRDVRRWGHVNEMTQRVTVRRMRYVRLARDLTRMSAEQSGIARQVVPALMARVGIEDRLELVDDQLEVQEDVYELANDRLSEYRYFRVEAVIEAGVAVLLLIEVVVMFRDLYLTHGHWW